MATINKRFVSFATRSAFDSATKGNEYSADSIVFIKDTKEIWAKDTFFPAVTFNISDYLTKAEAETKFADTITNAKYDKQSKTIQFLNGETVKATIDATDFIKDGMVDKVEVKDNKLVITFNTDADKEEIEIEISEIFDADNYYSKDDIDNALEEYAKSADVTSEIEEAVDGLASEEYVDNALENYYTKSETYTKSEVDEMWTWAEY